MERKRRLKPDPAREISASDTYIIALNWQFKFWVVLKLLKNLCINFYGSMDSRAHVDALLLNDSLSPPLDTSVLEAFCFFRVHVENLFQTCLADAVVGESKLFLVLFDTCKYF